MNRLPLSRWALALSIVLTMLACSFLQGSATETAPSYAPESSTEAVSTSEPVQDQTSTEEPVPDEPSPLDDLLDLRSIQFNLTALYPDQTSNSVQGKIDLAGNMHFKFTIPDTTGDLEIPDLPPDFDIYVVDGIGYRFNDIDNSWAADPEPVDYRARLIKQMHGIDGPGLWLDLLPEGSLQSAGEEIVGGFTTEKVAVNGLVADQTITGNLWFDTDSYALVQVELHVPVALLSVGEEPAQGELKITLETQKADAPTITVPTK